MKRLFKKDFKPYAVVWENEKLGTITILRYSCDIGNSVYAAEWYYPGNQELEDKVLNSLDKGIIAFSGDLPSMSRCVDWANNFLEKVEKILT